MLGKSCLHQSKSTCMLNSSVEYQHQIILVCLNFCVSFEMVRGDILGMAGTPWKQTHEFRFYALENGKNKHGKGSGVERCQSSDPSCRPKRVNIFNLQPESLLFWRNVNPTICALDVFPYFFWGGGHFFSSFFLDGLP